MGVYVQVLALIVIGIFLLWFGYTIFLGSFSPSYSGVSPWRDWRKKGNEYRGEPGDPQICPICSMKLDKGELVKTLAFPSITGGMDRLMYIRGCYSCLQNNLPRKCPICGSGMNDKDFLVSRMFERPNRKNHVHVVGCNHCKRTGSLAR
ncbi:MAG: hypothetical protein LBI12_07810 [Treponema sp.]|jgi:hypothetical protein|nr:hypothetical protein [Treponema sp.]